MSYRLSIVLAVALASPTAPAAVINVPGDQPSIQAGINAASPGDEVVVAPGTYVLQYFQIIQLNKNITLRSSDGAEVTTVQGGGQIPVFSVSLAPVIQGFTITGGYIHYDPAGLGCP